MDEMPHWYVVDILLLRDTIIQVNCLTGMLCMAQPVYSWLLGGDGGHDGVSSYSIRRYI